MSCNTKQRRAIQTFRSSLDILLRLYKYFVQDKHCNTEQHRAKQCRATQSNTIIQRSKEIKARRINVKQNKSNLVLISF